MGAQSNDRLAADEPAPRSPGVAVADNGVGEIPLSPADRLRVRSPSDSVGKSGSVEGGEPTTKKTDAEIEYPVDEPAACASIDTLAVSITGVSPDTSPSGIDDKSDSVGNRDATTEQTEHDTDHQSDQPAQVCTVVWYHDDADMCIRIAESQGVKLVYKACSTLLAAASPSLKALIDSKKHGIPADDELVLDVADFGNDSYGLDIVLSIIHYKFHGIPTRPDVDQLYSIARVIEKCDCAHLLVPYMEKW
jgi:hypothetical protein